MIKRTIKYGCRWADGSRFVCLTERFCGFKLVSWWNVGRGWRRCYGVHLYLPGEAVR